MCVSRDGRRRCHFFRLSVWSVLDTPTISTYLKIAYVLTHVAKGVSCTKCLKDETVGDRSGNVYYCDDPTKPECCEQQLEYTCCELETTRNLREQLVLWGGVIFVAVVITVLLCCLCRDHDYCSTDKPVLEKLGIKKVRQDADEFDVMRTSRSSSLSSYSFGESPLELESPRYVRSSYGRRVN
ncbi:hypothetical protein ScPMuIL_015157 [Solemya velum]